MIAISVIAIDCIQIPKDDQGIFFGTRVHHHLELGVECFLHGEFTYPSRSHRDQRNNTHSMGDSQSHDTLVDMYDLSNHRNQWVGDGHSHSFKMPLSTAGPVVGLPTPTDPPASRSPDF